VRTKPLLRRRFDAGAHVLAAIAYETPSPAPFSRRKVRFSNSLEALLLSAHAVFVSATMDARKQQLQRTQRG
jgi:hypothetical protein